MSSGSPVDAADLLSPEFAPLLETFAFGAIDEEVLALARTPLPGLGDTELVERRDSIVTGQSQIPLRVHRPRGVRGTLPCVYSIHGGGFVIGSYNMDDLQFESWCPDVGVIGVSVDYRLAPEASYPDPLEDCYRGLKWTFEHAAELGVNGSRIGVYGPSAGGGLAAGLSLLARDRAEFEIAFQLLESPMLDDRQVTVSSNIDRLPVWSKEANEFGWRCYLGDAYGTTHVSMYAAPGRAEDLAGLPPSYISVGGADGFRDEDVDFGLRLNQAGVATEMHVYPGAPHGYQMFVDSSVARQSQRDSTEWLARILG